MVAQAVEAAVDTEAHMTAAEDVEPSEARSNDRH